MTDTNGDDPRWKDLLSRSMSSSATSDAVMVSHVIRLANEDAHSDAGSSAPRSTGAGRRSAGATQRMSDLASPSLSSSSRTPSSCNIDDVDPHDFSDVSSLDGSDFEVVEAFQRPDSALSGRSHDSGRGLGLDQSMLSNRHGPISSALLDHVSETMGSSNIDSQDADEAALLNSNLNSTYSLSRDSQQAREAERSGANSSTPGSAFMITPQASVLATRGKAFQSSHSSDATPSISSSQFTFPDPLGEAGGRITQTLAQGSTKTHVVPNHVASRQQTQTISKNYSYLANTQNSSDVMRNPWTPVPSDAKTMPCSSKGQHSSAAWSRGKPSPGIVASSTFKSQERATTESLGKSDNLPAASETVVKRPVQKTCIDLPASTNMYYLGRRPSPAVLWRISHSVKASLSEVVGESFSQHSEEVKDGVHIRRSVAGHALGSRVMHLKEVDCTEPFGASAEDTLKITSFLKTRGAKDVLKGNALIICCLENGETMPATSLSQHLATLLADIHASIQPRSRLAISRSADTHKPLVLPVLCPKQASNLDDGDSIVSEGHRDLVQQLTRKMDAQVVEREWNSILADTMRALKAIYSVPHLHVDFAPGSSLESVITFESLVWSASSWFKGDTAWACRAAMPLIKAKDSPLSLLQARADATENTQPTWLIKTRKWLRGAATEDPELAVPKKAADASLSSYPEKATCGDKEPSQPSTVVYSVFRMVMLVLSLVSFGVMLGSGTIPFRDLPYGNSLGVFHKNASVRFEPIGSSMGMLQASPTPSARKPDSLVVPPSFKQDIAESGSRGRPKRKTTPPKASASGKVQQGKESKAIGKKLDTALSVKQGPPKNNRISVYTTSEAARFLSGIRHAPSSSELPNTGQIPFQKDSSFFEILLQDSLAGCQLLIEHASAQWQYWLVRLLDFYTEIFTPAARLYQEQASNAVQKAAIYLDYTSKQFKVNLRAVRARISDGPERENARVAVNDAARGAHIVREAAAGWFDSVAVQFKAQADVQGTKLRSGFKDASIGALVVRDRASVLVAHATEKVKTKSEEVHRRIKKGPDHPLAKKANGAREVSAKFWGRAMRQADEQLDYWFFAHEL